jgi:hypothetical protein
VNLLSEWKLNSEAPVINKTVAAVLNYADERLAIGMITAGN